jgi:hypothetical protein
MTILLLYTIMIIIIQTTTANTAPMLIDQMLQYYSSPTLEDKLPCILRSNCSSCTSTTNCVWISGSPSNGVVIMKWNNEIVLDMREVSFCWKGGFYGTRNSQQTVTNVMSKSADVTSVHALFGLNDFTYKQCTIRGGMGLLLLFSVPIVIATCFVGGVFVIVYLCCCRKRISKRWV